MEKGRKFFEARETVSINRPVGVVVSFSPAIERRYPISEYPAVPTGPSRALFRSHTSTNTIRYHQIRYALHFRGN